MSKGTVKKIWKRSSNAEGNPFHKSFTREALEENEIIIQGLKDSSDWHRDRQVQERKHTGDSPWDRAILIQTEKHINQLKKAYPELTTFDDDSCFGENLFIQGNMSSENICVGDVISVMRGDVEMAVLQVTSPRWPCYKINMKHSNPLKCKDYEKVQGYCAEHGTAGIFCKVLKEGHIKLGDDLVVTKSPFPEWTCKRVSSICYGGSENRKDCSIREFRGDENELEFLLNFEELTKFEWRDRLIKYVEKKNAKVDDRKIIESVPKSSMNEYYGNYKYILIFFIGIIIGVIVLIK